MKSYLLLFVFLIGGMFFAVNVEGQQVRKEEAKGIRDIILSTYFNQISRINPNDGFRNQFINEPDSMASFYWEDDPENEVFEDLRASIKYQQVGGQTLISEQVLITNESKFLLIYSYDSENRPTGASISEFFGGIPFPVGSIIINRNAQGHITKSFLTVVIMGDEFISGDSTRFDYNMEEKISEAMIYYYDSEGEEDPGWYPVVRYYNIDYCGGDDICAMDCASSFSGFLEVINYTNLEWFGNGSALFLEQLQPDVSESLVYAPYLYLPEDPIKYSSLSYPIGGEVISSSDLGATTLLLNFTSGENNEQLCLYSARVDDLQDTVLSSLVSCHLVNEEGQLILVENFFDLELQEWSDTEAFTYNVYGYNDLSSYFNSQTSYDIQDVFTVDNENRLRKTEHIFSYTNEGGFTSINGSYADYFYDGISSVVDDQLYKTFNVFPNPSPDFIFVAIESADIPTIGGELRMRNLKGELILSKTIQATDRQIIEIGLSQYPSGLYILEAISLDGKINAVSKFIKN